MYSSLTYLRDPSCAVLSDTGSSDLDAIAGVSGLKSFRIVRLSRILRTAQFVSIFRFVIALRVLITSILHTLKALVWAMTLLVLIVYAVALPSSECRVQTHHSSDCTFGAFVRLDAR